MTLHSQKLHTTPAPGQPDADGGAILLVDDRQENLIALKAILEPLGHPVISATSGTDALRLVLTREFAVMLLDVQMPGMNGYDLARQIKTREHNRHTPIIFLTALNRDDHNIYAGYSVGAADYMFKPLDPEVVRSKVAVFVELHRRGKQLERQARLLHDAERLDQEAKHTGQLQDRDARLQSVIASAGEAIITFDDRGRIDLFNNAAERIFGRSAELARKQFIDELIHPDTRAAFAAAVREAQPTFAAARGRYTPPGEPTSFQGLRPDGDAFNLEGVISCVPLQSGTLFTLIAHDTTARERAERILGETRDQLHQAQKLEALGRLAGGIAHDFNNILTIVRTCCDMLRLEMPGEAARVDLDDITAATTRAADLTRQLLMFSRKQVLQTHPLDLNDIITGLGAMLRRLIPVHIEMTTTLQQRLWAVEADRTQIEQILINLSVNARDAMPDGGRLSISTRNVDLSQEQAAPHEGAVPGPYVMLTVTDTGVGMNEQTQYRVFEPFFTTKQPGRGTGLGLATVYGIVKQAGGHIWLYSEPAHGTTFKIFFPRSSSPSTSEQTHSEPVSRRGTESILLVEDDTSIRTLASRILSSHGYHVICAGSGEEALEMLSSGAAVIDLVITDIILPGMNGQDTASRLRDVAPKVKTLFMSGYTDDEIVRRGLVQKNAVFLTKPFSADDLLRKAREALDFLP